VAVQQHFQHQKQTRCIIFLCYSRFMVCRMKNLETMGAQEMNAEEVKEENGGIWAAIVAIGIAAWGIGNLIHDCFCNHRQSDITVW